MKKEKAKKPFYLRWWFITIAVIILLGVISSVFGDNPDDGNTNQSSAPTETQDKVASTTAKTTAPTPAKISQEAIKQTVDDMKTRDHIKDASFTVKGDHITMKLVADDATKSNGQKYADSFLRTISMYTDNKPTGDSYGAIYDDYYVDITVDDTQGMQVIEGKKLAGYKSFDWE